MDQIFLKMKVPHVRNKSGFSDFFARSLPSLNSTRGTLSQSDSLLRYRVIVLYFISVNSKLTYASV